MTIDTKIALAQVRDLQKQLKAISDTVELLAAKLTPITEVKVISTYPIVPKALCCLELLRSQGGNLKDGYFMSKFTENVKDYFESSHKDFRLLKCKECGQLFLFEFDEYVSFGPSGDIINCTYVPVDSEEIADGMYERIKKGTHIRQFPIEMIFEDSGGCTLRGLK